MGGVVAVVMIIVLAMILIVLFAVFEDGISDAIRDRQGGRAKLAKAERARLNQLEELVDNLRELVYEHPDRDSTLGVILLDELKKAKQLNQRKD